MATEDVFVRDITIPKGMQINCLVFAMHRDPEYWPEPEVFKPERLVALDPYPVKIVSSSHCPPPPPIVPQHRQTGGYCRCTALSEFWCTRPGVTLSTALLGTVVVHFLHSAPRLESISTKQTHMSLVYISYSLA